MISASKSREISRDLWVPDSEAKACFYCNSIFNTFRRKHHCRICGSVFCSKCCTKQRIEPANLMRICIPCSKLSIDTCKTALKINKTPSTGIQLTVPRSKNFANADVEDEIYNYSFNNSLQTRYVLNKDRIGKNRIDLSELKIIDDRKISKSSSLERSKNTSNNHENLEEFTKFMHERLSKKCPEHLASEIVSIAQNLKHNSYHIKTVQNENTKSSDPRKITITSIKNAVVGSQASLTTPKTIVSGKALFVSSSIQPSSIQNSNNSTNLQQIHQENYRLQKCVNKANMDSVSSIIVLGSVCWAFQKAAEEHKMVIISCHSERQFKRLMKCLSCEKPVPSIYSILEDDFSYEYGFGDFEGFEYLKVFDKQLFCYKIKNMEFKSVILICKDLVWLKWIKKLLIQTVLAFVNWRCLHVIPWKKKYNQQTKQFHSDLNNNQKFIYSVESDEFQVPHFLKNNNSLTSENFADFSKQFENLTENDERHRNIRNNQPDLSDFNPIHLKIYGLNNDPLETNYSAEDLESPKKSNISKTMTFRNFKKYRFFNKKLCTVELQEMKLYDEPDNGKGYFSLGDFLDEKNNVDIFKGCSICKNKFLNHLTFYEHGEYRVEVSMKMHGNYNDGENNDSIFIAFENDDVEIDQLCLQEVRPGL